MPENKMNEALQMVSDGVSVKWHHEKRIAEYDMRGFSMRHATIDDFFAHFQSFVEINFPHGRVLSIFDFTAHRLPPFSAHFKQRSREVSDSFPANFYGRSAVLIQPPPLTHIYRLVVRGMNTAEKHQHTIERQVFTKRDEALAWLHELLEEDLA